MKIWCPEILLNSVIVINVSPISFPLHQFRKNGTEFIFFIWNVKAVEILMFFRKPNMFYDCTLKIIRTDLQTYIYARTYLRSYLHTTNSHISIFLSKCCWSFSITIFRTSVVIFYNSIFLCEHLFTPFSLTVWGYFFYFLIFFS